MPNSYLYKNITASIEQITTKEKEYIQNIKNFINTKNISSEIRNNLFSSIDQIRILIVGDSDYYRSYVSYIERFNEKNLKCEIEVVYINKKTDISSTSGFNSNFTYALIFDLAIYKKFRELINLKNIKVIDFVGSTSSIDSDFEIYSNIFNHIYIIPLFEHYLIRKINDCSDKKIFSLAITTFKEFGHNELYYEFNIENIINKNDKIEIKKEISTIDVLTINENSFKNIDFSSTNLDKFSNNKATNYHLDDFSSTLFIDFINKENNRMFQEFLNCNYNKVIPLLERYDFIRGTYLLRNRESLSLENDTKISSSPEKSIIRLYNLRNLSDDILEEKDFELYEVDSTLKEKYIIKSQDILISMRGSNFRVAYVLNQPTKDSVISDNLCIFRAKENTPLEIIIGDFLFLKSTEFKNYLSYITNSQMVNNLNTKTFEKIYIRNEFSKELIIKLKNYLNLVKKMVSLKKEESQIEKEIKKLL